MRRLEAVDPVLRARVAAALSLHIAAYGRETEAATTLAEEALVVGREAGDAETIALGLRTLILSESPEGGGRCGELASELIEIARAASLIDEGEGYVWHAGAAVAHADIAGYRADIEALREFVERTGSAHYASTLSVMRAALAMFEGRFDDADEFLDEMLGRGLNSPAYVLNYFTQIVLLRREQGRLDELIELASAIDDDTFPLPARSGLEAFIYSQRGDIEAARAPFGRMTADGYRLFRDRMMVGAGLALFSDVTALMGDVGRARELYAIARPFAGLIPNLGGEILSGSADRSLGMLAAVFGDFDAAERHFEDALGIEVPTGFPTIIARTKYWYARMLATRGSTDDLARAQQLLADAHASATAIGSVGLIRPIEALQRELATASHQKR
jgi:tetratricopeptide (TPR) repeat protein